MKDKAQKANKRLDYNDLAKSLGMLTIIWGHVRLGDWSNAFVYAWHIPLFFFLSGMVFNKSKYSDFTSFFVKKVKSLLIPYAVFSILTWIVWAIFSFITHAPVDSYWMPLAQTVIAQGSGGFLVHNVPLWFVSCLFVMEMMYYFLADMKKGWIISITLLLAATSYYFINYWNGWDITLLPWSFEVACLGIPIYAFGHLIVQEWGHLQMQNWVGTHKGVSVMLIIALAAIVVIGSSWNGSISFGHSDLGRNVFVSYACAMMGTIMMILICILLADSSWNVKNKKIMNWLKWFGRNSFTAMVIHNPIKGIVCVIVGLFFHCNSSTVSHNSFYSLIAFTITLGGTIIGILVTNWIKNKYKALTTK